MKKVIAVSAFALLGVVALSSCKKDYECVTSDGTVISECNDCKSSGLIKESFDASCSLSGGSVQTK